MSILDRDERRYLEEVAKGPVRVVIYRGGKPSPPDAAAARKLDELCAQRLAKFIMRKGDRNSPSGDVWLIYEITNIGRCALEASTGRHGITAAELRNAGCG